MQARKHWTKTRWFTVLALGTMVGACADQSPTAIETTSFDATAAYATTANTVASVTVYPRSYTLKVGLTKQLVAVPRNSSGQTLNMSGRTVRWTTSNPGVATVSSTGVVRARAGGRARILVTIDGVRGYSVITVDAPETVASVAVTPGSASVAVKGYAQLMATPKDASGNPISGHTIQWSSSNTSVARVYSNGLVAGLAKGTATIRATAGGKTGSATVTVGSTSTSDPLPDSGSDVAQVIVYPGTYSINTGQGKQLIALARNSKGETLSLSGRTVRWTSSNAYVASVSSTGLVIGRTPGIVTIRVSIDGTIGSSTITVSKPF